MPIIHYNDQTYLLNENETVLDCLLRHQVAVSYSCKSGACQACLMQSHSPGLPPASQMGLKDAMMAQGYFLACQCVPASDLDIGEADIEVDAVVKTKAPLNACSVLVEIEPDAPFDYRAGQYIQLKRADGLVRSYSIASLPGRPIQIHVERIANGAMSNWVHDELQPGDRVKIRGPVGDCFYLPGEPHQPLLLAGTGTGLAPLVGIAHDALENGHQGNIHLYHGSLTRDRLYLVDELFALAEQFPQLHYTPCVKEDSADAGIQTGDIEELVLSADPAFKDWRVYLCGNPALVNSLRKKIFLKGASNKNIFSDAFLLSRATD
ncbi:MAG: FAD-binding oxidoreductase [Candidatus Hinthialibacter antarcticus]|nr:FAD-binding oxidoreductase [Candidatus Hinthialibacter antarcticus]